MAISVSIETLDQEDDGNSWNTGEVEHCPHSFVAEMNTQGGVFLGNDIFIPIGRITSLWFDTPEADTEAETDK